MNILLLGSGGREHALAWKLTQSPLCTKLYIAPGNPGTKQLGQNVPIPATDFEQIESFVWEHKIGMVVVGPEDPLVKGIYDYFQTKETLQTVILIGPSKAGAMLEGSKAFAKKFLLKHNIPTAAYQEFTAETLEEGLAYIDKQNVPIVLKADGLAAGKGVLICQSKQEAKQELKAMLTEAKFGAAGAKVVIEQFLDGIEFSMFALTDGKSYKLLPEAKDYKRIGEGDTGLNTGGMGAISPVPFLTKALQEKVEQQVIQPTIQGLIEDGITYKGFIYFGLIKVNNEPFVIEYNCRMGDPETEVVMPRIKSDLVQHFIAVGNGTLEKETIELDARAAATIVLTSKGYPEEYEKRKEITINSTNDALIFHAGTKLEADKLLTNGGRVLTVTAYGDTIQQAVQHSLNTIQSIHFDGMYYRHDIGYEFPETSTNQ